MKKAFTLSELLIAMTVLGILLALMIPAIINTKPDERRMLTKKAYYVTEQVISSLINDPSLYPDNTMYCPTGSVTGETCTYGFDDDSQVTYNGETYSGNSKFPKLFAEQVNVIDTEESGTEYKIKTSDGMIFDFSSDTAAPYKSVWAKGVIPRNNTRNILIDVNGEEEPNCLETDSNCPNPDQFRIVIYSNGRMHIHEDDEKAVNYVMMDTKAH